MSYRSLRDMTDGELDTEAFIAHNAVLGSRIESFTDYADRHRNRVWAEQRRRKDAAAQRKRDDAIVDEVHRRFSPSGQRR